MPLPLVIVLSVFGIVAGYYFGATAHRPGERLFWRALASVTLVMLALRVLQLLFGE